MWNPGSSYQPNHWLCNDRCGARGGGTETPCNLRTSPLGPTGPHCQCANQCAQRQESVTGSSFAFMVWAKPQRKEVSKPRPLARLSCALLRPLHMQSCKHPLSERWKSQETTSACDAISLEPPSGLATHANVSVTVSSGCSAAPSRFNPRGHLRALALFLLPAIWLSVGKKNVFFLGGVRAHETGMGLWIRR